MALFEQLEKLFDGDARVGRAPEGEDLPHQHPKWPAGRRETDIYVLLIINSWHDKNDNETVGLVCK